MWRVIKAEIIYQQKSLVFLEFLGILIMSLALSVNRSYLSYFTPSYLALSTPYFLFVNAGKENRFRFLAQLPVGYRRLALYRTLIVVISILLYWITFWIFHKLVNPSLLRPATDYMTMAGLVLFIYAAAFFIRDGFRQKIIHNGLTREKIAPYFILLLVVVQVWLLVSLFLKPKGYFHLGTFIDVMIAHHPFQNGRIGLVIFIVGCITTILSIFSYERSKIRY